MAFLSGCVGILKQCPVECWIFGPVDSRAHEFLTGSWDASATDAEVADAVKDKRSLKGLGNRPIKGYDEVMPVLDLVQRHPRPKPMGNSLAPEYKMHSATR
jgi:hypothetical protein